MTEIYYDRYICWLIGGLGHCFLQECVRVTRGKLFKSQIPGFTLDLLNLRLWR